MPELILGPLLRYVGAREATLWVETSQACEVSVLEQCVRTFHVEGHHYAIIYVSDLEPETAYAYAVALDGEQVWPNPDSPYPPSTIRTPQGDQPLRIVFGSCRLSLPPTPPYTLAKQQDARGRGHDALRALAARLLHASPEQWPQAILFLGDQVYADEVSQGTREFIRDRRDTSKPPGEEIADFEEYTRLYRDAWGDPLIRWLLSTVPSAMIFDDHDVNDDWNISAAWVEQQRAKPWWSERIIGGFMSYWIYQHLGNLSPQELNHDPLFERVRQADDAGVLLREFARRIDRDPGAYRWSYHRDFGKTRLLMMDSRAARVLDKRDMVDAQEWEWVEQHCRGDFDHLLLGTSLPVLLGPGIHYLEAWSEAVCAGAWGSWIVGLGERLRQATDLEHWSAFQRSFDQLVGLLREIGAGDRGPAPATVVLLSGDVHHAYLAKALFPASDRVKSAIYQAVCSPLRNVLDTNEQRAVRAGWSKLGARIGKTLARSAGVRPPPLDWRLEHDKPWFGNQVASLELDHRDARVRFERPAPNQSAEPELEEVFSCTLGGD